jgi:Patatin-like phospholipase
MPNEGNDETRVKLGDVLRLEKKHVHRKLVQRGPIENIQDGPGGRGESAGKSSEATALCLSGGGIRSATVALGFLQACDRWALLKKFDYLFTVSGGGYIGGWLTALIHRINDHNNPVVGIDEDLGALNAKAPGAAAIANLRRYSNYLTPHLGLFSGDSLALIAIYLRNLLLNGLILLALLAAATVLPKILYRLFASDSFTLLWSTPLTLVLSAGLAALSGVYTVFAATGVTPPRPTMVGVAKADRVAGKPDMTADAPVEKADLNAEASGLKTLQDPLSTDSYVIRKVAPLLLSLLLLSGFAYRALGANSWELKLIGWIGLWCATICVLVLFFWGLLQRLGAHSGKEAGFLLGITARLGPLLGQANEVSQRSKRVCNVVQILGAYAIGCIAFLEIAQFLPDARLFLICVPPALLSAYLLGVALFAGFVNPILSDDDREWWARSSGYLLFSAALWLIVSGVSLCGDIFPSLLDWFSHGFKGGCFPINISGVTWGSVATGISGLVALLTRDSNVVKPGNSKSILQMIGSVVFAMICPVFIIALVLSLSIAEGAVGRASAHTGQCYVIMLVAFVVVALTLSCVVNVNKFSLHNTYRNRLIRTFLGASHTNRKPNSFTGFDEDDNVYLKDIARAQRPYHVLCGTVNLYAGAELAWQERRAALFTFSRDFCGADFLDYRPTAVYGGPKGLTLGTAIAISGAAANPNMGFYTAPDRAFVMTLLNVRLGWWLGNPKFPKPWRREGPFPALKPLVSEMLALTRESSSFINVSDGGHFDDTAVYEAVRRWCSKIFLVDVNTTHENVARMIRKVRIDFGVDITLEHDLYDSGVPGQIYRIDYPATIDHPVTQKGILIRVYPALEPLKDELPADVQNFANGDPNFPADQLENQWYGEAQFESYRKLGREIGMRLFANALVKPTVDSL